VSLLQHQGNRGFEKDAPRECSPDLNGIVAGPFEICADGAPRRNGQLERKTRAELASVEHGWILVNTLNRPIIQNSRVSNLRQNLRRAGMCMY